MGIIPGPITPGVACTRCFPADATPTLLKVFFGGIEMGDLWTPDHMLPPNGYHDYIQTYLDPCQWTNPGPEPTGHVIYAPLESGVSLYDDPWTRIFWGKTFANCTRYFSNRQDDPVDEHYYGGSAFICTPAELETWIEMVTPVVGPDPRLECFPMEDGEIVLKFCNIQAGTNIKIKLDTALL